MVFLIIALGISGKIPWNNVWIWQNMVNLTLRRGGGAYPKVVYQVSTLSYNIYQIFRDRTKEGGGGRKYIFLKV